MDILSTNRCFGGEQIVARHASQACGCDMTFGLYLPPAAARGPVPVLWYLSGLTCTHENAMVKAGAQAAAAAAGLAVVFPDTSPRGAGIADDAAFDLGQGAGFYLNATEMPWAPNFRMWDYVLTELPALICAEYPLDPMAQGITGHSMGGHGALTLAMTHPEVYSSCSAISPITHPTRSDWGRKQFAAYLGPDETNWEPHDATLLMRRNGYPGPILVDQGQADPFIDLLQPEALAEAAVTARQPFQLRLHEGYDHSYFFVASVIADHLAWHARELSKA